MSRLPIPHFIQRLFAEKADKPVIVTVTVDANGASMSAADQAKLTADMVMCWYTGDVSQLKSNVSILPGSGSATVTGTARSSTAFTIAFMHSANENAIASVIQGTGYIKYLTATTISIPAGINKGAVMISTTLNPGVYIIVGYVVFQSEGQYNIKASIDNPYTEINGYKGSTGNGWNTIEVTTFLNTTQTKDVALRGYQASDAPKNAIAYLNILKLK